MLFSHVAIVIALFSLNPFECYAGQACYSCSKEIDNHENIDSFQGNTVCRSESDNVPDECEGSMQIVFGNRDLVERIGCLCQQPGALLVTNKFICKTLISRLRPLVYSISNQSSVEDTLEAINSLKSHPKKFRELLQLAFSRFQEKSENIADALVTVYRGLFNIPNLIEDLAEPTLDDGEEKVKILIDFLLLKHIMQEILQHMRAYTSRCEQEGCFGIDGFDLVRIVETYVFSKIGPGSLKALKDVMSYCVPKTFFNGIETNFDYFVKPAEKELQQLILDFFPIDSKHYIKTNEIITFLSIFYQIMHLNYVKTNLYKTDVNKRLADFNRLKIEFYTLIKIPQPTDDYLLNLNLLFLFREYSDCKETGQYDLIWKSLQTKN